MPPFPTLHLGEEEVLRLPPTLSETPLDPYLHLCMWWKFMSCLFLWKWAESSNSFMWITSRGSLPASVGVEDTVTCIMQEGTGLCSHVGQGLTYSRPHSGPVLGAGPTVHPIWSPREGPSVFINSTLSNHLSSVVPEMICFPIPQFKKLNVLIEKI